MNVVAGDTSDMGDDVVARTCWGARVGIVVGIGTDMTAPRTKLDCSSTLFGLASLSRVLAPVALGCALFAASSEARAGIPECGNIRLEDVGSCEIKGDLQCTASCEELGVYKKACATKLHTVCRDECTLDPEPTCEDECTTQCSSQCDLGLNIICQHNCFGECAGVCGTQCENAADPETCIASCEATCDGECDIQCAPVVEGSCYQHCIECCGGSCGAQANMTCQTSCQEEQFESCEYEFRADCMGSCSGDGALFCDGEYVMSGDEIEACVTALIERGIADIDLDVDVDVDFDTGGFCSIGDAPTNAGWLGLLLLIIPTVRRRQRRHA